MESKEQFTIAIVAYGKYAQPGEYWFDDDWLRAELIQQGHYVDIIDWTLAGNLLNYDSIYISSTWNFHHDPMRFLRWLKSCESDGKRRLINDSKLLQKGVSKYDYMSRLMEHFPNQVTPTRFFPSSHISNPSSFFDKLSDDETLSKWIKSNLDTDPLWEHQDLVLKPACSADGHMTYLYKRTNDERLVASWHQDKILTDDDQVDKAFTEICGQFDNLGAMLQIYQTGVEAGEYSLTFFDGLFSHAIRKPAGFRQDISGKRVYVPKLGLPSGMLDTADNMLNFMRKRYGEYALTRVRTDFFVNKQSIVLSEFEFLEPNTNLKIVPLDERSELIKRYADAIIAQTARLNE